MSKVRGIRGATTVAVNSKIEILDATKELLQRMIELNSIDPNDVATKQEMQQLHLLRLEILMLNFQL